MADEWTQALDRLLAGLAHDANGRTASLRGLTALVESGAPAELLLPLLRDESERAARHSGGLHALAPDLGPEPLDPRDLIALAGRALDAIHITLQPAELPGDAVVAVHASRTAILRALLAAVLAAEPESGDVLESRIERRGDRVALIISSDGALQPASLGAPQALLASYDGSVAVTEEGIELTLPALG